jgi:hypothetical protein
MADVVALIEGKHSVWPIRVAGKGEDFSGDQEI